MNNRRPWSNSLPLEPMSIREINTFRAERNIERYVKGTILYICIVMAGPALMMLCGSLVVLVTKLLNSS